MILDMQQNSLSMSYFSSKWFLCSSKECGMFFFTPSSFVNSLNNDVKIVASNILGSVIVVSSIAHQTLIFKVIHAA